MRKTLLLLALCLSLAGCGDSESSGTGEESKGFVDGFKEGFARATEEVEENEEAIEYIDGFENASANYEKFNSYASENGLGDTLIFIDGTIINQTKIETDDDDFPVLALIIEQEDGNRWCASVCSHEKISGIENEEVRVFGTYVGFSDVMNLPAIAVSVKDEENMDTAKILELVDGESGNEIWNFYKDFAKPELEKLAESEKQGKEENQVEEEQVSEEDTVKQTEGEKTKKFIHEKMEVEFLEYKIEKNAVGEDCLVLYFNFTNNSDENQAFIYAFSVKAFQDGVELETSLMHVNDETKNHSKEIQPGTTIVSAYAFVISENRNPIDIEIEPWISFSEKKLLEFTIDFSE